MVAGGADCDQILALLLGIVQRADRGQLGCDLVAAQRVDAAAALPVCQLLQLKAQSDGALSRIQIEIFCLISQGTSRIIAVFHKITFN